MRVRSYSFLDYCRRFESEPARIEPGRHGWSRISGAESPGHYKELLRRLHLRLRLRLRRRAPGHWLLSRARRRPCRRGIEGLDGPTLRLMDGVRAMRPASPGRRAYKSPRVGSSLSGPTPSMCPRCPAHTPKTRNHLSNITSLHTGHCQAPSYNG